MNDIKVIWYDGGKANERPKALVIDGQTFLVRKWIPVGVVKDFIGMEREVHKVVLEDGSTYRIEYLRSLEQCIVGKLKSW